MLAQKISNFIPVRSTKKQSTDIRIRRNIAEYLSLYTFTLAPSFLRHVPGQLLIYKDVTQHKLLKFRLHYVNENISISSRLLWITGSYLIANFIQLLTKALFLLALIVRKRD